MKGEKAAAAIRMLRLPWVMYSIKNRLNRPGGMIAYSLPKRLASDQRTVNLLMRYFSTEETYARAGSLSGRHYLCVERVSDRAKAIG